MLLVNKNTVDDLHPSDTTDLIFCPLPESEKWRINFIHEITEIKFGEFTQHGFEKEELDDILKIICVSYRFCLIITTKLN